jgi:hypothetical protein
MKKILLYGLVCMLLSMSLPLFADGARVLPAQVGRFFIVPTYGSAIAAYDADGKATAFAPISMFNLGFALEYGVTDWISAAFQWAPGATISSDLRGRFDDSSFEGAKTHMNDLADLFLGAKIQIVGPKAPVVSTNRFRAAIAPGVLVPLTSGPDYKKEIGDVMAPVYTGTPLDEAMAGQELSMSSMDKHAFAAGFRTYFDWILSDNFSIYFFNENLFYLQKKDIFSTGPGIAMYHWHPANQATGGVDGEVDYKYKLTFEIEPVISAPLPSGLNFKFLMPLRYVYTPAFAYSFSNGEAALTADSAPLNTDSHKSLYFSPGVQFFVTNTALPLEFRLQYGIPLYIRNGTAMNLLTFQMRIYFRT